MYLPTTCACGKKQHITKTQRLLLRLMHQNWGDYKDVQIYNGKRYKVPLYYIVTHGLTITAIEKAGFKELKY